MSKMPPALFSPDRKYRFLLTRRVGPGERAVNFLMLNPSTADEECNDPTISRCVGFARTWGFAWLLVTNLSPFRAARPRDLLEHGPSPTPWRGGTWRRRSMRRRSRASSCSPTAIAASGRAGPGGPSLSSKRGASRPTRWESPCRGTRAIPSTSGEIPGPSGSALQRECWGSWPPGDLTTEALGGIVHFGLTT